MPALERDRWIWPKPAGVPFGRWHQVADRMATGIWAGRSYVFGRAVAYDVPAYSDAMEYRSKSIIWHPSHPPALVDGHEGDVIATAAWSDDSPDGLDVLFEVRPEHLTTVMLAAMSGRADLSIRTGLPGPNGLCGLEHVALVPAGDVPGAEVHAVATPWSVHTRDRLGDLVHAGEGPAAYEPTASAASILARLEADTVLSTRSASELYVPLRDLEVRSARSDGARTLEGVCVPYDSVTTKAGTDPEVFRLGAFAGAITDPGRVKLRDYDHGHGRPPAGVATRLVERRDGLHGVFKFHDTPEGRSAWENAREGTYGGLSVGFVAMKERRSPSGVREVLGAHLDHVSLVDEPAYDDARILGVTPADVAPHIHAPATPVAA